MKIWSSSIFENFKNQSSNKFTVKGKYGQGGGERARLKNHPVHIYTVFYYSKTYNSMLRVLDERGGPQN